MQIIIIITITIPHRHHSPSRNSMNLKHVRNKHNKTFYISTLRNDWHLGVDSGAIHTHTYGDTCVVSPHTSPYKSMTVTHIILHSSKNMYIKYCHTMNPVTAAVVVIQHPKSDVLSLSSSILRKDNSFRFQALSVPFRQYSFPASSIHKFVRKNRTIVDSNVRP